VSSLTRFLFLYTIDPGEFFSITIRKLFRGESLMSATARKLLPLEATPGLDSIKPSPAKMGLSESRSLYEAAWSSKERKEDLLSYYIPHLEGLSDREIKGELRYWVSRLRGIPYEPNSRPHQFIVRILATPTYTDPRWKTFSSADRGDIQRACIALRGLVVPWFHVRMGPKRIEPEKRIAMAVCVSRFLGLNTDWRLVNHLTSYVGSKTYDRNELNWLTRYYPIARVTGEERFGFGTSQRQYSREFAADLNRRPFVLRLDQIEDFKRRVGLTAIDLGEGIQKSLFPVTQLPLWNGDGRQEHLFGMPVLPPWQGEAAQEALF
jgi:hypothetical protein